jgi:hypothetical protein
MKKLIVFLSLMLPSLTWASFFAINDNIFVNIDSGTSTFTLEFNKTPDFFTVDEFGRQANAFQYYIYGDQSLSYPNNYDAIIRGGEMHLSDDTLRIRKAAPPSNDAGSGGWGAIIAEVPWSLDGSKLSFTVNTFLLTSFVTDKGVFKYDLMTTEWGGMTSHISGKFSTSALSPHSSPSPVPLPSSFPLLLTGLILFSWLGLANKSAKHQKFAA